MIRELTALEQLDNVWAHLRRIETRILALEEGFVKPIAQRVTDQWCMALHGNHDEHQCHKKPGHNGQLNDDAHKCYCGVWW